MVTTGQNIRTPHISTSKEEMKTELGHFEQSYATGIKKDQVKIDLSL
jgi:hypothetical protein